MANKRLSQRQIEEMIIKKQNVLSKIYSRAYGQMLSVVEKDAGTLWRRDRAKRMLTNLNGVIKELDKETAAFIKKEIPSLYEAVGESAKYDVVIAGKVVEDGFSKIHRDAISSISESGRLRFAESMAAVRRDAIGKIELARKAKIRETIGVGQTLGKAQFVIANEVLSEMKEEGITALKDKAGKKWAVDRYARMLTGEMLADTSREAIKNVGLEHGFDVYKISRHGANDACRFHEGKIFSMTGKTEGFPTYAELKDSGEIFHVGCLHSFRIVVEYPKRTEEQSKQTGARLKKGDKISNHYAKKNKKADESETLKTQEESRDKRRSS